MQFVRGEMLPTAPPAVSWVFRVGWGMLGAHLPVYMGPVLPLPTPHSPLPSTNSGPARRPSVSAQISLEWEQPSIWETLCQMKLQCTLNQNLVSIIQL